MVKSFICIHKVFIMIPWPKKLPLDFSAAVENSPRRTTFIIATIEGLLYKCTSKEERRVTLSKLTFK